MTRPADVLPRVVRFDGIDVYAPMCWHCGDDRDTEWVELPSCETMAKEHYVTARGVCIGPMCRDAHEYGPRKLSVDLQEAWHAREPERLAHRLAELQAGAA